MYGRSRGRRSHASIPQRQECHPSAGNALSFRGARVEGVACDGTVGARGGPGLRGLHGGWPGGCSSPSQHSISDKAIARRAVQDVQRALRGGYRGVVRCHGVARHGGRGTGGRHDRRPTCFGDESSVAHACAKLGAAPLMTSRQAAWSRIGSGMGRWPVSVSSMKRQVAAAPRSVGNSVM